MAWSPDTIRRWLGGICLAVAVGMLIAGQTVLGERLKGVTFIYYWLACVVFTGLTLLIALLDLRVVRLRSRHEQSKLIAEALREIAAEKDKTADKSGRDE